MGSKAEVLKDLEAVIEKFDLAPSSVGRLVFLRDWELPREGIVDLD